MPENVARHPDMRRDNAAAVIIFSFHLGVFMFLRSLLVVVSVAAISLSSAQAGWWFGSKEKSRTEEQETDKKSAKKSARPLAPATRAYRDTMHAMHAQMDLPLAGSADVDFVRQMIPHHEAALAMAKTQQQFGKDERLKRFNDWVIQAQTVEIGQMKNWLRRKDNGKSCAKAEDYYGEAMKAMHHAMMIKYSGDADVDYVRGMIAHHQGAVDMAAIWLRAGSDPELRPLVHDIYTAQTAEIAWMKRWLEARGRAK